jgi:DUF1680 family protein
VKQEELPLAKVKIIDDFWLPRVETNAFSAILHQWSKLEESKNIDNFRIAAGQKEGFREGLFYCDSDAHKWSEAASIILDCHPYKGLEKILKDYVDLIQDAQTEDGYLFTYNQIHFPKKRWKNCLIEHELYTHGHLIEAGIAYHDFSRRKKYLNIAIASADLILDKFGDLKSKEVPGHQEIEIALIKLYRKTGKKEYLSLAEQFIEQRGKHPIFFLKLAKNYVSVKSREKRVERRRQKLFSDQELKDQSLLSDLEYEKGKRLVLRYLLSALTGKYFQNHKPIRKITKPVGHSVRFGYYMTAVAMLYQETGDSTLLETLELLWDEMVQKRMSLTGGIGSLALIEGFGRDYELDNLNDYNETCAAISSLMWSWEMLLITSEAKYADLMEWQLYNAINPGMSLDGKTYSYMNPLESEGKTKRQEWYQTACCPPNIARILAKLGKFIYTYKSNEVWIHQYIGNETSIKLGKKSDKPIHIVMESELPWEGRIEIKFRNKEKFRFSLNLRIPSWARDYEIIVNGQKIPYERPSNNRIQTASGYSPYDSFYVNIKKHWKVNNKIEIYFPVRVNQYISHSKIKKNKSKVALSRGPILYCFVDIDNPGLDVPNAEINLDQPFKTDFLEDLEGITVIRAKDFGFNTLTAIPYYSWGNREDSSMQVWIDNYRK